MESTVEMDPTLESESNEPFKDSIDSPDFPFLPGKMELPEMTRSRVATFIDELATQDSSKRRIEDMFSDPRIPETVLVKSTGGMKLVNNFRDSSSLPEARKLEHQAGTMIPDRSQRISTESTLVGNNYRLNRFQRPNSRTAKSDISLSAPFLPSNQRPMATVESVDDSEVDDRDISEGGSYTSNCANFDTEIRGRPTARTKGNYMYGSENRSWHDLLHPSEPKQRQSHRRNPRGSNPFPYPQDHSRSIGPESIPSLPPGYPAQKPYGYYGYYGYPYDIHQLPYAQPQANQFVRPELAAENHPSISKGEEVDPIKTIEEYMILLRRRKVEEATEVLKTISWIDSRLSPSESCHKETTVPQHVNFEQQHTSSSTAEKSNTAKEMPRESSSISVERNSASPTPDEDQPPNHRVNIPMEILTEHSNGNLGEGGAVINDSPVCLPNYGCSTREPDENSPGSESIQKILEEIINLRQEVIALRKQQTAIVEAAAEEMDMNWLQINVSINTSSAIKYLKRRMRQEPSQGMQRLEWTCECGEELFADFAISDPTTLQQMQEFLAGTTGTTGQVTDAMDGSPDLESGMISPSLSSSTSSPRIGSTFRKQASNSDSDETYVGSNISETSVTLAEGSSSKARYLEVCVNVGKYETQLVEIQITPANRRGKSAICTDAHLFRNIHDRYFALRKQTWRRFFYRPIGIRFVNFGVQAGRRVGFFSEDSLPPESELVSKRYEYSLIPPIPPPIDSRTFLHYFWKHRAHADSTSALYVERLPKKLGDSLIRRFEIDELRQGWGIHILEGPNKPRLCCLVLLLLIASFCMSLAYDLITKTNDTGFTIGQWFIALVAVGFSTIFFSLEDEANCSYA